MNQILGSEFKFIALSLHYLQHFLTSSLQYLHHMPIKFIYLSLYMRALIIKP